MATEIPNKYSDPFWSDLASKTEAKLELPKGVLVALINNGERSNHDAVSSAGARTVMQIIPETRKAAIDKYGIDPYLSPENAVEVGGLLIKDSLKRNKGDIPLAIAEYHGGTNRNNWGAKTKAYVSRVISALPTVDAPAFSVGNESTFDRVSRGMQPQASNQIAAIYDAYKAGRMTPEEAADFKADVNAGKLMLPKGSSLNNAKPLETPQDGAIELPIEVAHAYQSGAMNPQEKADLEADLKSGLVKLPNIAATIPGGAPVQPQQPEKPTSITDDIIGIGKKALGAAEAAVTGVTGATTGALGYGAGTLSGIITSAQNGTFGTPEGVKLAQEAAEAGANQFTYAPKTPEGQQYSQAMGEALQAVLPAAVLPETATLIQAAKPAAAQTVQTVKQAGAKAAIVGRQAAATVVENMPGKRSASPAAASSTPGTMGSAGAAATDLAAQRRALGSDFPVPLEGESALTKGQEMRDFAQTQFEREAAKNPEAGLPLRERFENQNKVILQNFDAWIDQTGAEAPSLRDTGILVDKAVKAKADAVKTKIKALYKQAEQAGEMEQPVTLTKLVEHLNEMMPEADSARVLIAARKKLLKMGGAIEDANGDLIAQPISLKNGEKVRQTISRAVSNDAPDIRQSTIMKSLYDQETAGMGGNLYKEARRARAQFAREFENRAVISDLINNKRGMEDRKVAFEDVHKRAILDGSLDDVRMVRRTLQTQGEEGKQAWKELQGQTVAYLKDQATRNVATNSRGDAVVSAAGLDKAVKMLDKDGKLDFVFGKKGAQQLRDINELAKLVLTTAPNAVNSSNTASILLAALDMGMSGAAGLPLPVASGLRMLVRHIKDNKLKARVQDALKSN